jgi:hypothetical protein
MRVRRLGLSPGHPQHFIGIAPAQIAQVLNQEFTDFAYVE